MIAEVMLISGKYKLRFDKNFILVLYDSQVQNIYYEINRVQNLEKFVPSEAPAFGKLQPRSKFRSAQPREFH